MTDRVSGPRVVSYDASSGLQVVRYPASKLVVKVANTKSEEISMSHKVRLQPERRRPRVGRFGVENYVSDCHTSTNLAVG